MMWSLYRTARLVAAAVVVGAGAVGCVSLPDASSVHAGSGAGVDDGQGQIRSSWPGPVAGASRQDIVEGYLGSMLAFPSDPAVVREFLTPRAAGAWNPEDGIRVYQDPTVTVGLHSVQLGAHVLGSLDDRGSWTSSQGEAPRINLQVHLVQVGGEWRIDNPVPGTLVNTADFDLYFHQFSMFFYDPTYALIAPDPVYLTTGTPGSTATSLVRNMLEGPTGAMAAVARSAAPPGVRLTAPVTVSAAGYATVSLSDEVAALDPNRLSALAKQLALTLRQDRIGVKHLTIRTDAGPLLIQGRSAAFSVDAFKDSTLTTGSRTLYALSDKGRLVRIAADGSAQDATGPISKTLFAARSVAVDPSDTFAALVSSDGGRVRWAAIVTNPLDPGAKVHHYRGADLLRPSWDPVGLLWLVDMVDGRATLSVANGDTVVPVDAPNIEGLHVRAFAVSRDGMRLAAVLNRGSQSRLVVGFIKRPLLARRQTPVTVVGAQPIGNSTVSLTNIRGLTWVNSTTIAVLAQDSSSGEPQPYQVSVDGSRVSRIVGILRDPPTSLAAGPGSGAPLVIGTSKGLYRRTADEQWAQLAPTGIFSPAYPS